MDEQELPLSSRNAVVAAEELLPAPHPAEGPSLLLDINSLS